MIGTELKIYQSGWEKCESKHTFGPAVRDHYLIHYIVEGKGTYMVGDQTYNLSKGEGFIIFPDEVTIYMADEEEPWEYYWVGFNGINARALLEREGFHSNNPVYKCNKSQEMEYALRKLYLSTKKFNVDVYEQLGYLYLFMSSLVGRAGRAIEADDYIERAVKYIDYNYSYDISIAGIAKYIGIERSYLYRLFIKNYGLSPNQYLLRYRLQKAQEMLEQSTLNITEIAYSCGFQDTSHFSKMFKKHYGKSPKKYRK